MTRSRRIAPTAAAPLRPLRRSATLSSPHPATRWVAAAGVVLLWGTGCTAGTVSTAQFRAREGELPPRFPEVAVSDRAGRVPGAPELPLPGSGPSAGAGPLEGTGTAPPIAPEVTVSEADLFGEHQARELVNQLRAHLGGTLQAVQLVVYPTYAIAQVRSPSNSQHVDRYSWRAGSWEGPEPVPMPSTEDIAALVFDPDAVALELLPVLVARTAQVLAIEQGEPTHVIVERNLPFDADVVLRVYVSGPRQSGRIDYHADGAEKRVYPG